MEEHFVKNCDCKGDLALVLKATTTLPVSLSSFVVDLWKKCFGTAVKYLIA